MPKRSTHPLRNSDDQPNLAEPAPECLEPADLTPLQSLQAQMRDMQLAQKEICEKLAQIGASIHSQPVQPQPPQSANVSPVAVQQPMVDFALPDDRLSSEAPSSRAGSPPRSVTLLDKVTSDPFDDIRQELTKLRAVHCENGKIRHANMSLAAKLLQARQFNASANPLQYRSFLKFFLRTFNQARADPRDAAALFQVALHPETLVFLEQVGSDFENLETLVFALAEKCLPSLTDMVTIMRRFSLKLHKTKSHTFSTTSCSNIMSLCQSL